MTNTTYLLEVTEKNLIKELEETTFENMKDIRFTKAALGVMILSRARFAVLYPKAYRSPDSSSIEFILKNYPETLQ